MHIQRCGQYSILAPKLSKKGQGSRKVILCLLEVSRNVIECNHYFSTSITSEEQVCIPVGCVPPACCPLPACTTGGVRSWGVSALEGVSGPGGVWSQGCLLLGDVCYWGGCLLPGGVCLWSRGVCISACNEADTPLWTDRHLWKHNLPKLLLRAVIINRNFIKRHPIDITNDAEIRCL